MPIVPGEMAVATKLDRYTDHGGEPADTERDLIMGNYAPENDVQRESAPIELKVITGTIAAGVATLVVGYVLRWLPFMDDQAGPLKAVIAALVTAAITGIVGYVTRHTFRNDRKALRSRR